ncbi:hypothetical protein DPMN_150333 [Dreissena polymorpha]|uniref:Uncharacterized protein n=1 Tax=Dreissena polymorpha TaxID=45954 RepID=A0A9D4J683_DREPO|nr:hypothetical protein DPMN_150333 [Dreissena polymorpha]
MTNKTNIQGTGFGVGAGISSTMGSSVISTKVSFKTTDLTFICRFGLVASNLDIL